MGFIRHIPGIRREPERTPAPVQKGIGVIGLHEGRTLLLALDRATKVRPVAGCDLSEEKLAESRKERPDLFFTRDYAEMLARPDVDIVAIYTPDPFHGEHIVRAFQAGKDVISTKPLVNSVADARRILETARRTGRKLLVGQSTRFFEPFRRQRAAYEAGEMGELELVDAHYIHRMDWFYEKSPWAAGETDWVFLGLSHPVDLLRWYLGPIREVHAYGVRSSLGASHGLKGLDVYAVNAVAESGRIGRAMGNYGVHELPTARNCIELMLYGSKGTSLARYHDMQYIHTAPDGSEVTEDPLYALRHYYFNSEVHGMHYGEFANYAEYFAGALLDGTPYSPGLEEGLETVCVMEAVRRSALSGKPVEVAPLLAEIGLEVKRSRPLAIPLAAAILAAAAPVAAGEAISFPARETISLDGEWQFRRDGAADWKTVTVPSSFQMHEGMDWHGAGWYRRKLPAVKAPVEFRVLLHFQAAATRAEVSLDGKPLGAHLGGWTPFRFDITEALRGTAPEGGHEVLVRLDEKVGHNTQGFLPVIAPHFGGLWQSVSLLVVPDPYIDDLRMKATGNPDTGEVDLEAPLLGTVPPGVMNIDHRYATDWPAFEPGAPNLRKFEFRAPGLDRVVVQAAKRKVETRGDTILLNGRPLQVRGVLNWGYYPPENYPKVDEARFRRDLELIRSWGFNLIKFCLWIPPHRYLEICDEMGMLAWMEYPTWHPQMTKEHLADLRKEFTEFFEYDRNHPSVIIRSLTCETGSSAQLEVIQFLYDEAHRLIPGALVEDDSSWIGWNRVNDFWDDHPYGNNHTWVATLKGFRDFIAEKKRLLPMLLGEAIAADTWVPREPILAKVGDARPFWVPTFFDDTGKWLDRTGPLCGPGDLDRLVPDSLRYAMLMRKYQMETYRREMPAGGYVVSVMRDFSTAAMGFLDYHDRPHWSPEEWSWQGDTGILLATEGDRRSFAGGEKLTGDLLVSHFGKAALADASLEVTVRMRGEARAGGKGGGIAQEPGTLRKVFSLDIPLPEVTAPEPIEVQAVLTTGAGTVRNAWPLWLVPRVEKDEVPAGIVTATRFDNAIVKALEDGGKVFLVPDGKEGSLPLNAHWFLRGAPFVPRHALTEKVPQDLLVDLQHFDLASDVIPEVGYLDQIDPLLMLWDTHDRKQMGTHGLIYETRTGKGRLLVCSARLDGETNAAGRWLKSVLLEHLANGPEPRRGFTEATWRRIREKLHEEKIDLVPLTWKFHPDGKDEGLAKSWHLPTFALDDSWKDIKVGAAWEGQGWPDLDGWAWYRLAIKVPETWAGREVYLSFEGVDDCYELYVEGKIAGKGGDLATKKDAFNEKKSHRLTDLVKPGKEFLIAVRVHDWYGAGGIFRPVTLSTAGFYEGPEVLKP